MRQFGAAFAHTTFDRNAFSWGTTDFVAAYRDGRTQAAARTMVSPVGGGMHDRDDARGNRYGGTGDYEPPLGSPIMRLPRERMRQDRRGR